MGIDAEILVRVKGTLTDEQIRRLSYLACSAFGHERFFLQHVDDGTECEEQRHVFTREDVWEQDGPDIEPEDGEMFLRAHLWTRYYGPGYERGDAVFLLAFARWIEESLPAVCGCCCDVWYGGDSGGACAEPFDHEARERLWRHFVEHDHRPYRDKDNQFMNRREFADKPTCPLCLEPMPRFGFGKDYASYSCACGWNVVRRDGKEHFGTKEMLKEQESDHREVDG